MEICRISETSFVTRARRRAVGLRARVDTRHADTAKDKRTGRRVGPVPKRPAAHTRAMVVLAHDSSHIPFPSCSNLHTRTHSQARTHGASNCQRGMRESTSVCRANARAHAATPSASQHVSKHPTGRHGSGGLRAASGRRPVSLPRVRGDE